MTDFLKRTSVIWTLFVLMIVIGAGFGVFNKAVGGTFLDMTASAVQAREILAGMTAEQRDVHFWVTVLLDTAYPLAYGGFLAGMALRFWLKVSEVREATAEEVEHGHAHGASGIEVVDEDEDGDQESPRTLH